ncbi:MAG: hypothetical protein M1827_005057 [Pycnora praestabilis]|nr:MAG: hypothetical protein M1827_005057 [Pycnora praestabilis]
MRCSPAVLLALSTIASAQQQRPLFETVQDTVQGWLGTAQSYIPSSFEDITAPFQAGAAKAAEHNVVPLTMQNWRETLTPSNSKSSEGPEEWMVFITGGNKTCFGFCEQVETAWNKSAALLSATPSPPNLAYLNCDDQRILCNVWSAGPPSIWHILLPKTQSDQSRPVTTIRIIPLSTNATTTEDIVKIHSDKTWIETPVYEGYFHPFDGQLAQLGLNVPLGYALFAFGLVPSWAFMLIISMGSRTLMGKRVGTPGQQAPRTAHPGGAPAAG